MTRPSMSLMGSYPVRCSSPIHVGDVDSGPALLEHGRAHYRIDPAAHRALLAQDGNWSQRERRSGITCPSPTSRPRNTSPR